MPGSRRRFPVPVLHLAVQRMPPVVPVPTLEKTIFSLNLLSATGTPLLLAGIASALALGVGFRRALRIYGQTLLRVRVSLLTISAMLALGFTTRYGGTDTTMGLAFASTGSLFPFFSPIIGWLGVALTGSDTSSNVLFGNLQKVSAEQLGYSPILMCAANSSGGVMGKMIDAQSIVVAGVATGGRADSPDAGTVLRAVFWHSIALAALVGLLVYAQARSRRSPTWWCGNAADSNGRRLRRIAGETPGRAAEWYPLRAQRGPLRRPADGLRRQRRAPAVDSRPRAAGQGVRRPRPACSRAPLRLAVSPHSRLAGSLFSAGLIRAPGTPLRDAPGRRDCSPSARRENQSRS